MNGAVPCAGLSNAASSMRISSRNPFGHASCPGSVSNITMTLQWREGPSGTGLPKVRCIGSSSTAVDSKTLMLPRWPHQPFFSTGFGHRHRDAPSPKQPCSCGTGYAPQTPPTWDHRALWVRRSAPLLHSNKATLLRPPRAFQTAPHLPLATSGHRLPFPP